MNRRLYTLFPSKSYTSDTTEVIDLKSVDPISSLVLAFKYTNASASMTAHPAALASKIEIVDGSDVIFSLDGHEADALDYYNLKGARRSNYYYALNGGEGDFCIGIMFGRYAFDPLYAFDPKKFTNPQLRVSVDVAAGGNAATPVKLQVFANLFDQKVISPVGFLMSKEIKKYTISSSAHEYTDLPLDYPYRGIYVRGFVAGTEGCQVISNIKLIEDYGKRIPFDHNSAEILRCVGEKYPDIVEHWYFALDTSNKYIYCTPSERVAAVGDVWAAAAVAEDPAFYDGDGGRLKTIAAANASNSQVIVKGAIPHAIFELPVCDKDDPADFWNVSGLGNLRLDITGAASATGYIFVQQVRPY